MSVLKRTQLEADILITIIFVHHERLLARFKYQKNRNFEIKDSVLKKKIVIFRPHSYRFSLLARIYQNLIPTHLQ